MQLAEMCNGYSNFCCPIGLTIPKDCVQIGGYSVGDEESVLCSHYAPKEKQIFSLDYISKFKEHPINRSDISSANYIDANLLTLLFSISFYMSMMQDYES
ncbi:MAG: hypothetical protein KC414_12510, partial [Romboutsia sp.]|nr:hypothetical protein [Romboutsia sp.]